MRFSLYLRGHFNGSLQVAIEENGTVSAVPVWERNGQAEDNWEPVALELTDLHHGYIRGKTNRGRNERIKPDLSCVKGMMCL